jgi:hypothetical protein
MGLQVWLPLQGNLENKGLSKVTLTTSGTPTIENGKIGQCYTFNENSYLLSTESFLEGATKYSLCCWFKSDYDGTAWKRIMSLGNHTRVQLDIVPTTKHVRFFISKDGTSSVYSGVYSTTLCYDGQWHHVCGTFNNGKIKLYIDGVLEDSATGDATTYTETSGQRLAIGAVTTGDGMFKGSINDVRIYDECLSPMQVKLISQGLVAHYLLNRNGLGATNLLKNGFGELGAENWQNASNMYDDVPPNHPEIYHSYRKVESVEYIPIYRNHTYQFSTWIKASSSSGSSYPSLKPYDADKNFINCYNCTEGFNLSTMTTLTQELKKGDTKIYVNDLSKWNANSGHYYNYAALFGYKDSTGYIYPDGTYTRDLGIFGSEKGAKTNLDKTNNIITLNSAYTGTNKPVGTKVCASTEGKTYYYPLNGINNTTITDWTYKETTFSSETSRLSAAKYVRVFAYSNCYQAGITLTDLTLLSTEDDIEYDVSGYCHNGIKYNITDYSADTPRYSVSTVFNGSNSYINIGRSGMVRDEVTINAWAYMDDWTTYSRGPLSCTEDGGWCFEKASNKIRFAIGTGSTSNTYKTTAGFPLSDLTSGWHMITGTYDGLVLKEYVDGVLNTSTSAYTTKTPAYYHASNSIIIGAEATGGGVTTPYFNGRISDVRIYATALSDADVLALYKNSAYIDSFGNVFASEYNEE